MSIVVACPSGLAGEIRGVKGGDIRALAKSVNPLREALERCWVKTTADGPYTIHDGVRPRWSEVLAGDIFTALLGVYKSGFGPDFDFEYQCQDLACRKRNHKPQTATINLDTTVEVRPLSAAARAGFLNGNRFTCEVAGRQVTFKLTTGADLFAGAGGEDATESDDPLDGVASALVEVAGIADRQAWLDDLDGADIAELIHEIAEMSCGPNLIHQVQCQRCYLTQTVRIPFAQAFRLRRRPTIR